ncbi:MAG: winged helix-turn-helix transcriptional regulator [Planctomycetota bacterium]
MRSEKLKTLQVLDELARDEALTQRKLSKRLGVSAALINLFLKRLAAKGYIKLTTFPPKRMRYVLTPQGLREKARLTYEFLDFSLHYYRDARSNARKIFDELSRDGGRRVLFYGAEELAELAYLSLVETPGNLEFLGVADEKTEKKSFLSKPVLNPEEAAALTPDAVLVTRFDNVDLSALRKTFGERPKIVRVYAG